ncbi:ABC transporter ATP-binding protein [Microbacterium sp. SLBN-146]|uniref:ABC transporter ATP-binding protein n=1 Tax=Microbacterium sp. SLBN-146 TaxID=2768457 RepID=UPI00114E9CFF|nr:ABC transporter ATP-binding protein [Microbacterium sp. SLBN-146]TQJ30938.1 putative spermidine/putrescine transport system ATP-binding protein [Microbacterium sp. SLBN-146]
MSAELALNRLTKSFPGGGPHALDDLSLTVAAGTCTAVLGPSGSGKSTLLRVVAGLEDPDAGDVRIGGVDVGGIVAERRGVGMVFQRSLLFPHLSVRDNVAFADRVAGMPKGAARGRADTYLEMVQLGGFGDRRVGELSGGQEQRVAIARALAAEPAVLLLDEPFSALDPALRGDMHDLLDAVRRAVSPTIVLVTHDRDEASRVADRIALMEHGVLLHESSVADAYRRPRTRRVAQLMGGRNEVAGTVRTGIHHSELGALPVPDGTAQGDGILVVRQEDLSLADADAPLAADVVRVEGVVEAVSSAGARTDVVVSCRGGIRLHAETSTTLPRTPGERVAVAIPLAAVHVVAR